MNLFTGQEQRRRHSEQNVDTEEEKEGVMSGRLGLTRIHTIRYKTAS